MDTLQEYLDDEFRKDIVKVSWQHFLSVVDAQMRVGMRNALSINRSVYFVGKLFPGSVYINFT